MIALLLWQREFFCIDGKRSPKCRQSGGGKSEKGVKRFVCLMRRWVCNRLAILQYSHCVCVCVCGKQAHCSAWLVVRIAKWQRHTSIIARSIDAKWFMPISNRVTKIELFHGVRCANGCGSIQNHATLWQIRRSNPSPGRYSPKQTSRTRTKILLLMLCLCRCVRLPLYHTHVFARLCRRIFRAIVLFGANPFSVHNEAARVLFEPFSPCIVSLSLQFRRFLARKRPLFVPMHLHCRRFLHMQRRVLSAYWAPRHLAYWES